MKNLTKQECPMFFSKCAKMIKDLNQLEVPKENQETDQIIADLLDKAGDLICESTYDTKVVFDISMSALDLIEAYERFMPKEFHVLYSVLQDINKIDGRLYDLTNPKHWTPLYSLMIENMESTNKNPYPLYARRFFARLFRGLTNRTKNLNVFRPFWNRLVLKT